MVFSSIPFLFFFLPLCLILYYAVSCLPCILHGKHSYVMGQTGDSAGSRKYQIPLQNGVLLVFSLIFYAWGEPVYILLMLFASAVDFGNGLLMERFGSSQGKRRIFLISSVVINLSVLAFFKYADFVLGTINAVFHTELPLLKIGLPI